MCTVCRISLSLKPIVVQLLLLSYYGFNLQVNLYWPRGIVWLRLLGWHHCRCLLIIAFACCYNATGVVLEVSKTYSCVSSSSSWANTIRIDSILGAKSGARTSKEHDEIVRMLGTSSSAACSTQTPLNDGGIKESIDSLWVSLVGVSGIGGWLLITIARVSRP